MIVPTYDRCSSVQRAIGSVFAQTFRDFELIVVDDGSRDKTRQAICSLAGVDYLWQPHRGVAAARNAGLRRSTGQLVAFLDSDDLWLPEHLAVVVAMARRHPEAVLVSTSPGYSEHGHAGVERSWSEDPFPAILTRSVAGFVSSTAVRRAAIEEVGGFDESLPAYEDTDLWLRLSLRGRFALLERRTALIVRSRSSLSAQSRRDGVLLASEAHSLRRLTQELDRAGRPKEAAKAQGLLMYLEALQRLKNVDDDELSQRLTRACGLLAELSDEWGSGVYRAGLVAEACDGDDRGLSALTRLAAAWPRQRSPMGAALHASAAVTALRCGRPGVAAKELIHIPRSDLFRCCAAVVRSRVVRAVSTVAIAGRGAVFRRPFPPG